MKATIFRLEETLLCFPLDEATIVVAVQPSDREGYEVTIDINNERIGNLTEHYETEEYAMLAYQLAKEHVRKLAKRGSSYASLEDIVAEIKRRRH
jgi:imidazoleglycerol phosphate dehydratase HisB